MKKNSIIYKKTNWEKSVKDFVYNSFRILVEADGGNEIDFISNSEDRLLIRMLDGSEYNVITTKTAQPKPTK